MAETNQNYLSFNAVLQDFSSVVQDNITTVLYDNITTVLYDNITTVLQDNITTVVQDNITIVVQDNISLETTTTSAIEAFFSLIGIMGNCLTIRAFLSMGLKDGATLSLLCLSVSDLLYLSVSDLLYLICIFSSSVSYIFLTVELVPHFRVSFPVDPYGVHVYFAYCGGLLYYNTMLNITFISVVRCLSVAKPMWFRERFATKKIYIIFITAIAVFTFFDAIPLLALMGIIQQRDVRLHVIRPTLWVSPYFQKALAVIWPAVGFFLPIAIQITVVVCAFLMRSFLKEALAFRQKHTAANTTRERSNSLRYGNGEVRLAHSARESFNTTDHGNDEAKLAHSARETLNTTDHGNDEAKNTKLSGRELKITQQMFVLSLLFIISNIPKVGYCMAYIIFPEFSISGKYGKLYEVVDAAAHTFQILFCCCNILVYFKYNSKFRAYIWK